MPGHEERKGLLTGVVIDEVYGLVGLPVGLPFAQFDAFSVLIPEKGVPGSELQSAVVREELVVEAIAKGARGNGTTAQPAVQMPFADVSHMVAGIPQDLAEMVAISRKHLHVVNHASVVERMLPAHQHPPVRRADRTGRNAMVEADALGRHLVDVRRDDLIVAVAAQHVRGLLIAEHEKEVRLSGCFVPHSNRSGSRNRGEDRYVEKCAS